MGVQNIFKNDQKLSLGCQYAIMLLMAGSSKETFRPHIENEGKKIYEFVNGLYRVRPPVPTLSVREDATAQVDSAMLSTQSPAYICSYYSEEDREIVIVPTAISQTVRYEQRQGVQINPLDFAERLLAQEYAHHSYASVNGFKLMDQINEHAQKVARTMPAPQDALENLQLYTWMTLPLARSEAIGLLAYMRTAEQFGHRDDYQRKFELDREDRRQTARQILLGEAEADESAIIQIASAFSYWLVGNWNRNIEEEPQDIIRQSLRVIDQDTVLHAMGYIIPE